MAKGQIRTVKSAIETKINATIPPDHPLLTWITRYRAATYYRLAVGKDRRTAIQRHTGRAYHQRVATFGEVVEWMPLHPEGRPQPFKIELAQGIMWARWMGLMNH